MRLQEFCFSTERMTNTGDDVSIFELVPAGWFRFQVPVRFAQHKARRYNGTLKACIDCALKWRPDLQFKRYQLHKDGLVLPGTFAVAGTAILIEERNMPDGVGRVCYYSCAESVNLD